MTILFDIMLAGFVTALLQAKAARFRTVAPVVNIELTAPEQPSELELIPSIRIVGA